MEIQQDQARRVLPGQLQGDTALHGDDQGDLRATGHDPLDQLHVRHVVLHIQHGARTGRDRRRCHGGRQRVLRALSWCVGQWQLHPKRAPHTRLARHTDLASHRFHQLLGDGQTQPRALHVRLLGAESLEWQEQPSQIVLGDPDAGICDHQTEPPVAHRLTCHAHLAALSVVVHRVGQEVDHHLLEPQAVRSHVFLAASHQTVDTYHASHGQRPQHPDCLAHHVAQAHRLQRKPQLAPLDPGDVEDLVDQPEQMPSRLHDVVDTVALFCAELVKLQQLAEPQNGVQGSPQLMAHP